MSSVASQTGAGLGVTSSAPCWIPSVIQHWGWSDHHQWLGLDFLTLDIQPSAVMMESIHKFTLLSLNETS